MEIFISKYHWKSSTNKNDNKSTKSNPKPKQTNEKTRRNFSRSIFESSGETNFIWFFGKICSLTQWKNRATKKKTTVRWNGLMNFECVNDSIVFVAIKWINGKCISFAVGYEGAWMWAPSELRSNKFGEGVETTIATTILYKIKTDKKNTMKIKPAKDEKWCRIIMRRWHTL